MIRKVIVNPLFRVKSRSFLGDEDYFRKYVLAAATKAHYGGGLVLLLLDSEDFYPAELGPSLLRRAISVRSDVEYIVVLAYREFETWFIAAIDSLLEIGPFQENTVVPPNPEAFRDAHTNPTNFRPFASTPLSRGI